MGCYDRTAGAVAEAGSNAAGARPAAVSAAGPSFSETEEPSRAERTRWSFSSQGLMRHLGARVTAVRAGAVEIELGFEPSLSQQHGFFHGGVVATLVDVAGGYAAFSLLESGSSSNVTVELKVSFLAPARGTRLLARGRVIKAGRTLSVCQSDVFSVEEGRETLCATALGTFMTVGPAHAGSGSG